MKKSSLVLLIATIAVLATLLFLTRPASLGETSYALPEWKLPIDTARVVRIDVRSKNAGYSIERVRGVWKYDSATDPGSTTLARLLDAIANFRLLGLVSSNPHKQDVFAVGESGTTVVVTSDDGNNMSLVVGKMSSLPSRAYVRGSKSVMVYLAMGLTPDVFRVRALNDQSRGIVPVDPGSILMISVESGLDRFTVRREGRRWLSEGTAVSEERVSLAIKAVGELQGEEVSEHAWDSGRKPSLILEIQERNTIRMEFQPWGLSDSALVLKTSFSEKPYSTYRRAIRPVEQLLKHLMTTRGVMAASPATEPPRLRKAVRETPPPPLASRNVEPSQPAKVPQPAPRKSETASNNEPADWSVEDEGALSIHVVKAGETLESIAQKYNATADQVKQWNLLTADMVSPGMELYVFVRK